MKFIERLNITRGDGELYLVRYYFPWLRWLFYRWFDVKIHNMVSSDDDCQHDHPWSFLSIILWGGYVEHHFEKSKIFHPGNILFRKAAYRHRLEIHQSCWTFVITFTKTRSWGFWTRHGWIPWRQYKSENHCE